MILRSAITLLAGLLASLALVAGGAALFDRTGVFQHPVYSDKPGLNSGIEGVLDDGSVKGLEDGRAGVDGRSSEKTGISEYSISPEDLKSPIKKVLYEWESVNSSMKKKWVRLNMQILKADIKSAEAYLEKLSGMDLLELGVPSDITEDNGLEFYKYKWGSVYRHLYQQGNPALEYIVKGFTGIAEKEKMSPMDLVYFMISFIQNIEYRRPGGELDILPPVLALSKQYGDCDTKSLLLLMLLRRIGVDCILFISMRYGHVMLGINTTANGAYKKQNGIRYYFVETTYPGWEIGKIHSDWDNLNYWKIIEI